MSNFSGFAFPTSLMIPPLRLFAFSFALCLTCLTGAGAQTPPLEYGFAVRAAAASEGRLPFWLTANREGRLDPNGSNALTRLYARRPATGSRLAFGFGIDVLARASEVNPTAYLHQLYGRLRYGAFKLTVGRKAETVGGVDPRLSVGSMMWSANAAPVPKVSLSFDYIPIIFLPGKVNLIYAKGYLGHGWLERDRYVKGAFVHEKYLYLRGIGPEDFPVMAHAGIVHNVIWGGEHPVFGKLPQDLDAYWRVFRAQTGNEADSTTIERLNALGNSVAMYDFGIDARAFGMELRVYRQFYIETGAAMLFRNAWDGLWGVSLRSKRRDRLVSGFLWEHVNTKKQSARPGFENHRDSYYNHFLYRSGWTYHGRAIGLPLIFGDGVRPGVTNNLLLAHHFGLEGRLAGRIDYRAFVTYTRNYGATGVCLDAACSAKGDRRTPRRDQVSALFEATGPLSTRAGVDFFAAFAVDAGALYPNNVGLMLGFSWRSRPTP